MKTQSLGGKNLTSFSDFKGVDFSSSPMDVSPNRASDMENFISEFGINKKRNGWCEMREFSTAEDGRLSICGIFYYKTSAASHIIVHAGDRFYRLTENGYERIGASLNGLCATRSQAFMQKSRMYITGCGDYLVYGTWDDGKSYELRRVYEDEDTYIPVTSVSVGGSDIQGKLDDPNMLTPWRFNSCQGVDVTTDSYGGVERIDGTYVLDAPIDYDSELEISNIVTKESFTLSAVGHSKVYSAAGKEIGRFYVEGAGFAIYAKDLPDLGEGFILIARHKDVDDSGQKYTCQNGNVVYSAHENGGWRDGDPIFCGVYAVKEQTLHVRCENLLYTMLHPNILSYELTVEIFALSGEKMYYTDVLKKTRNNLAASVDYVTSTVTVNDAQDVWDESFRYDSSFGKTGEDRFKIKFKSTKVWEDERDLLEVPFKDRITSCAFGTIFGVDGASDRLFLSGNPLMKNADFFSEADDFTYFPDTNVTRIGSDERSIVGYSRLSDGVLAVFKEKSDMGDATIYYRKGVYKEYFDELGNLDRMDAVFSLLPGNIGEELVSRFTVKDFGGDKLFLSKNGVFGIVLSENIVSGERYSRERSRRINARLCREKDLKNATAIVYNGKYYLAVNGHCYVADSRYRSTAADNVDGAWGYEWWYLTDIPAYVFAEIDGELWFGTEDGMLCRFDHEYTDRHYQLCQTNDLDLSNGRIVINQELREQPKEGDFFITSRDLYSVAHSGFNGATEDGKVIYTGEGSKLHHMAEGEILTAVNTADTGLSENGEYTVQSVDLMSGTFELYQNGTRVEVKKTGFSLLRSLKDKELRIVQVSEDAKSFGVSLWGEVQYLTEKTGVDISLIGKIVFKRNVRAVWLSVMSGLGTAMMGKNLHRISITCEPYLRGRLSFGYEARPKTKMRNAAGYTAPMSLEDLDFSRFSFDTALASSYSVRIFERNINYVRIRVESDTDTECAFNRIELLWSYTKLLGGLR